MSKSEGEKQINISLTIPSRLDRRTILFLGAAGLAGGALALNGILGSSTSTPRTELGGKPPEDPLTKDAKSFAMETWVNLLSSSREEARSVPQSPSEKFVTKLRMEIKTQDWKTALGRADAAIQVNWAASVALDNSAGLFGMKWFGEAEFSKISTYVISQDVNSVDRANGVEWLGSAGVEFKSKSRSVYSKTTRTITDRQAYQRWLSQEITDLPDFSDLRDDYWETGLEKKKGQWNRKPSVNNRVGDLGKELELPTSVLYFCETKMGCRQVPAGI